MIDDCHDFSFLVCGGGRFRCRCGDRAVSVRYPLGSLAAIVEAAALEQRPEPLRQRVERHAHHPHPIIAAAGHEVDLAELDLLVEMIETPLRAAALAPLDGAANDRLGEHQHVGDVATRVPAGVERAPTGDADVRASLAQRENRGERALQRLLAAPDPGVVLHRELQILVQLVRVLAGAMRRCRRRRAAAAGPPARQRPARRRSIRVAPAVLRELGGGLAGAPPEHEDVAERVAAEAVGAVQTARNLARRVQTRHGRRRGLGLDAHATHRVVDGRADLHRLARDVDRCQRMELLVHRRQLALDVVGAEVAHVEVRAAVGRPATRLHLLVDRARDDVARRQLLLDRVVIEHEARALGVEEQSALTAHRLGDQDAARAGWPDHAGGMELHELHVEQIGSRLVRHRRAVTRALPGVGGVAVHPPPSPAREHDGAGLERPRTARCCGCSRTRRTPGRRT